jgi:hypothetical protein
VSRKKNIDYVSMTCEKAIHELKEKRQRLSQQSLLRRYFFIGRFALEKGGGGGSSVFLGGGLRANLIKAFYCRVD